MAVVALLTTGCEALPTERTGDLGGAALFRSAAAQYTPRGTGELFDARLAFTFTNRTRTAVAFVNCGGLASYVVERWIGGRWKTAYSPAFALCLSPAIVVPAGGQRAMQVALTALSPRLAERAGPALVTTQVRGVYRIRWADARRDDGRNPPTGPLLPLRDQISNAFELRLP
jgi:hypothetical protein